MNTKVRHGVFETNSSSTHSISICSGSNEVLDVLCVDNNGTLTLRLDHEFGWAWESYNDAPTKAAYLAMQSKNSPEARKKLEYALTNQTGCDRIEYVNDFGYIDHESMGIASGVFENSDLIRDFIFNPKSFLDTGNDNESKSLPERECDNRFGSRRY